MSTARKQHPEVAPEYRHVADMIRMLLAYKNTTQTALAEHLQRRGYQMSDGQLSQRLKGSVSFRLNELFEVADFFGVSVQVLFTDPAEVIGNRTACSGNDPLEDVLRDVREGHGDQRVDPFDHEPVAA